MAKAEPKRDIKAEILSQARSLFNTHGFMNVSMRDIADSLNISVGNLTYHYRRKEELIMAVANDRAQSMPPHPQTIDQLDGLFRHIMHRLQDNCFLYCHNGQLADFSDELQSFHHHIMEIHRQYIAATISCLQSNGLMKPPEYAGQHACIAEAIHIVCLYWLPYNGHRGAASEADFLACVWGITYPFLTEKGRSKYISL